MSGFARASLKELQEDVKVRRAKPVKQIHPALLPDENGNTTQRITWLRRPADENALHTGGQYKDAINDYFEDCADAGEQPRLTGLALALGLGGPSSLFRLPRRRPDLRYVITRAITAISHGYESQIDGGNANGAIFMLKHLPDFDEQDPDGSAPHQHFSDKQEIVLEARSIPGAVTPNEEGRDLSPAEAYMEVIHGGEVIEINVEKEKKRQQRKEKRWAEDYTFERAIRELHETAVAKDEVDNYFPKRRTED